MKKTSIHFRLGPEPGSMGLPRWFVRRTSRFSDDPRLGRDGTEAPVLWRGFGHNSTSASQAPKALGLSS